MKSDSSVGPSSNYLWAVYPPFVTSGNAELLVASLLLLAMPFATSSDALDCFSLAQKVLRCV